MTTKLEILGPYTPEHDGPFCTRAGRPARVLCSDMQNEYSIVAIVLDEENKETVSTFLDGGKFSKTELDLDRDLMNAREVPVAREFWVNYYAGGGLLLFERQEAALKHADDCAPILVHTIHLREVLPGEGA